MVEYELKIGIYRLFKSDYNRFVLLHKCYSIIRKFEDYTTYIYLYIVVLWKNKFEKNQLSKVCIIFRVLLLESKIYFENIYNYSDMNVHLLY